MAKGNERSKAAQDNQGMRKEHRVLNEDGTETTMTQAEWKNRDKTQNQTRDFPDLSDGEGEVPAEEVVVEEEAPQG